MRERGIYLYVTNECNLKCDFCRIDSKRYGGNKKIAIAKYLYNLVGKKKPVSVCISGGEPTLFLEEIIKIIKFLRKNGIEEIFIETNGSYASSYKKALKITEKLVISGLTGIGFSLDSEHLKGVPFSYLVNAIKAAIKKELEVRIGIVDKKGTEDINTAYLDQLIQTLDAKSNIFFNNFIGKISKLLIGSKYILLKINKKIIVIKRSRVAYMGRARLLKDEFKQAEFYSFNKIDKLLSIGAPCPCKKGHLMAVDWRGRILYCPMAVNENGVFSFGNIKKDNLFQTIESYENKIGNITFSPVGLIKFYTYIKKNLKNTCFKDILNKKYYFVCEFCIAIHNKDMIKNYKDININLISCLYFLLKHPLCFIDFLGDIVRDITTNKKTRRILWKMIDMLYEVTLI